MQRREKRTLDERLEINQRSIEMTQERLKKLKEKGAKLRKEKKEYDQNTYALRIGTLVREILGGDVDERKLKAFLYEKLLENQDSEDGTDGELLEYLDDDEPWDEPGTETEASVS